jgi:TatD DNase family protein
MKVISGRSLDLVDAHMHLPSYPDPDPLVRLATSSGALLLSCTVNSSEAETNLRLRREYPATVRCFLGVHPSDAGEELPSSSLGEAVAAADGVGEIGLDAKYSDASPGSLQVKAFLDQLALAERFQKPVQVHSRGSERACLDALSGFRLKSVLMHWFEGEELVREVVSKGYFVSAGPAVLYSKKVRRVVASVPTERLLSESDGPVTYRAIGGGSGPGLIPSVLFGLSEVKGLGFDDMARTVRENVGRFLA